MWLVFIAFALILGALSLLVIGRDLRQQVHSRNLYLLALGLVPLLSLLIYLQTGSSQDLRILERMQLMIQQDADGMPASEAERLALIEAMRHRAEQTDSIGYWYLVANQYLAEGRYDQAVEGFARAVELSPQDPSLKAAQAEAQFLAAGNRLTQEVQDLIRAVMAVDPRNATINGLMGIAAYQVQEWQLAINYWQVALEGSPPGSPNAEMIRSSIEQARQMLGGPAADVAGASAGTQLQISVSLDPGIAAPPETIVFVFVRPTEGVAMPLAVKRLTVADLPAVVTLSDADAMVESLQLSRFAAVDVVARLAFGGTPTASPGDYEAVLEDWTPAAGSTLELVIRDPVQ